MSRSDKHNDSKVNTILGQEVEIKGDVNVRSGILVYGRVHGCINSLGTVRTAQGSFVHGNIVAKDAVISGSVEGDLMIEGKVTLGAKSVLHGNLKAGILVVESGARFEGSCSMSQETKARTAAPRQINLSGKNSQE